MPSATPSTVFEEYNRFELTAVKNIWQSCTPFSESFFLSDEENVPKDLEDFQVYYYDDDRGGVDFTEQIPVMGHVPDNYLKSRPEKVRPPNLMFTSASEICGPYVSHS